MAGAHKYLLNEQLNKLMIETNFKTLANKIEGGGFWHTSSIIFSYRSEERNY